ncbi:MAG: hypothetical protein CMI26_09625 [Opitutae bacterium]|nr:hypothetical protein [Opitutae bacterium]
MPLKPRPSFNRKLLLALRLPNQAGDIVGRPRLVPLDAKRDFKMTDRDVGVSTVRVKQKRQIEPNQTAG